MTIRLSLPARPTSVTDLTTKIVSVGGMVTGMDVTASGMDRVRVDVTCAAASESHANEIIESLLTIDELRIKRVSDRAFLAHLGGKLSMESKAPLRTRDDLSLVYTPGVARVCEAIAAKPEDAYDLTIKVIVLRSSVTAPLFWG